MNKRLGVWIRSAIVASIAWMIIGGWWYYRVLTGDVVRAWHEAVEQCQGKTEALKCTDSARYLFDEQLHDVLKYAAGTAFARLLMAWLIGVGVVYSFKWIMKGRKVNATDSS